MVRKLVGPPAGTSRNLPPLAVPPPWLVVSKKIQGFAIPLPPRALARSRPLEKQRPAAPPSRLHVAFGICRLIYLRLCISPPPSRRDGITRTVEKASWNTTLFWWWPCCEIYCDHIRLLMTLKRRQYNTTLIDHQELDAETTSLYYQEYDAVNGVGGRALRRKMHDHTHQHGGLQPFQKDQRAFAQST